MVYTNDTAISITDSEFINNTQHGHIDYHYAGGGGALSMMYTSNTVITITDSEFINYAQRGYINVMMVELFTLIKAF